MNPERYRIWIVFAIVLCFFQAAAAFADEGEEPDIVTVLSKVRWLHGPAVGDLGDLAEIRLPEGYVFADAEDTRSLMELLKNPTSGLETGFVAPASLEWFLIFSFNDIGYVREDEKDALDPDALLKAIEANNKESNDERIWKGWPGLTILGWEQEPDYDSSARKLEWAIRCESEGREIVNHSTRLLGREGVMSITLVISPDIYPVAVQEYSGLINQFSYKPGHRYTDYQKGDKKARYGLTALIVGGASAVAARTEILEWLWKVLFILLIVLLLVGKRIFPSKKKKRYYSRKAL